LGSHLQPFITIALKDFAKRFESTLFTRKTTQKTNVTCVFLAFVVLEAGISIFGRKLEIGILFCFSCSYSFDMQMVFTGSSRDDEE